MKRFDTAQLLSAATFLALASCSGGGGSTPPQRPTNDFLVVGTDPTNGATVFLNDPISVDFTTEVDLDSASLATMTFQALDQAGQPTGELVTGNFRLSTTPGDAAVGRRLQFVPSFASNNSYSNGGLRSGRTYLVNLVGGDGTSNTVLRNGAGTGLERPMTFEFRTRDGNQPGELFRNPGPGGPRRAGFEISTATNFDDVPLGQFGAPPLELRLLFDQALNPADTNLPVNFDTDPLVRNQSERGRIYLEYDDPTRGNNTWIPADVEIERNDLSGATLILRPVGVLPNNATIRIIVEASVEDIAGESNLSQPGFDRVFAQFRTSAAYEQQFDGIVERFNEFSMLDPSAAFAESQAEVGPGFVKAGFAFEGSSTQLDYEPTATEVVLSTSFTAITPKTGFPFTVSGGVFNFRNVTILPGVTVTGTGPNPMVWLCNGKFTVAGTLTVRGGAGTRVDTLNAANIPKAGGVGVCGGGNGGNGTPSATARDQTGATGRGPLQEPGRGGRGGRIACTTGCYTGDGYNGDGGGSGGGGGTMATAGDPNWSGTRPGAVINPNVPTPAANTAFQQLLGFGGAGCSGGSGARTQFLAGGVPGDPVFTDSRQDNNFWGSGIDVRRNLRINGELDVVKGGGGGGGGGDQVLQGGCNGGDFRNDTSGGGGGGGGGVLIIKALEEITITQSGLINADGGNGGGGEQVGASGEAGGGGAGAGGMVILMSAKSIDIVAHGSTTGPGAPRFLFSGPTADNPYQERDYTFAISADGGVCTTGSFGGVAIQSKYRANGTAMISSAEYDDEPLGGLGGMGIVQLMVPPGVQGQNPDGTNTLLDDNINFVFPGPATSHPLGAIISGNGKRRLLSWRGFLNDAGTAFVDDSNNPTNVGLPTGVNPISNWEGDIRPAPILLPTPFSARSRARSKWIDTGASQRRALTAADGQPRGRVGGDAGPAFEFAGLQLPSTAPFSSALNFLPGYINYTPVGASGVRINYPQVVTATPLASAPTTASYQGQPAYQISLANAVLGEANRYSQYEAELLDPSGIVLGGLRILSHTDRDILCAVDGELLPTGATQARVVAKFFEVFTNGSEGLGPTYQAQLNATSSATATPIANLRIGFAFHTNPRGPATGRYPAEGFIHDFADPGLQTFINTNGHPRYLMWDVLFDISHRPGLQQAPGVTTQSPRPELRFLRIPFRF